MNQNPVILEMDGDTARITLNRPEVHNALSIELSDKIRFKDISIREL